MITWLLRRARRSPSALTESNPARTEAAEEAPDEVQAPPRESLESFLSFGPRLSSDVQVRLVRPTLQSALISLYGHRSVGQRFLRSPIVCSNWLVSYLVDQVLVLVLRSVRPASTGQTARMAKPLRTTTVLLLNQRLLIISPRPTIDRERPNSKQPSKASFTNSFIIFLSIASWIHHVKARLISIILFITS